METRDWTQPPYAEAPGDLGPALAGARLEAVENDRSARIVRLTFALPLDAGTPEARFMVTDATHFLAFGYLPPAAPLGEGLAPEEAIAQVGDWARQGLVATLDIANAGTALVVTHARLHAMEDAATFTVEGYGEDPDVLVWWELRISGGIFEPVESSR